MAKPISELKEQVAKYFKANSYHRKSDVILSMQKETKFRDEYGITDSDIEKIVNETLLPGETKKGNVVVHRSKRGDVYTKFGTELPTYKIESHEDRYGDIWGESYRVIKQDEKYGGKGEIVLKNVPVSYAERWVMHKIDKEQPVPGKFTSAESMGFFRTSKPVIESDINKIIKEYGNASKGIDFKAMEAHSNLLYRAQEQGVVADGYFMMIGKKVTDDIIGTRIDSERKREVNRLVKLGMSKTDAEKSVKSGEEAMLKTLQAFPDWKKLIPDERSQTWKTVGVGKIVQSHYGGEFGGNIVWFASDNDKFSAVDANKIALIYKHFPGIDKVTSAAHSTAYGLGETNPDFEGSPLVFEQDGKVVAVVMPIFAKETPTKIREAATVSVSATDEGTDISDSENAAIHAWYDANPSKDNTRVTLRKGNKGKRRHSYKPDNPTTLKSIR
jgi:hypothetical protein